MRWERIDNVRREMVERGMSSLIVSDPMSIYYLSDVYIEPGERIAQLVVARHEQVEWEPVEELGTTERGAGGFGSTGR